MNPLLRLLAVGTLLTATLTHAAGFEGKISLLMTTGKGPAMPMDYSIGAKAVRVDMTTQGQTFAMITDLVKLESLILMPEQKMYMVMPIKQAVEKARQQAPSANTDVEKTGRTETILGYVCDEYVMKERDTTTAVWFAEGLGAFMGLGQNAGDMGGMFGGGGKKAAPNAWEEKFKGKTGFPLRVVSTNSKNAETFRMEATKIQPGALPASTFLPPAGWQKFQMPDLGGMLKGLGQ